MRHPRTVGNKSVSGAAKRRNNTQKQSTNLSTWGRRRLGRSVVVGMGAYFRVNDRVWGEEEGFELTLPD